MPKLPRTKRFPTTNNINNHNSSPKHVQKRINRIRDAMNDIREEKRADNVLTDEHRHDLASSLTSDASMQLLATMSLAGLGMDTKMGPKAIARLNRFDPKSGKWTGSFEEALVAIRYARNKDTANAIADAVADRAPHKVNTKTSSGRVSRPVDPSTRFVNTTFVKGSGAVRRAGMDFTETKKTKKPDDDEDDIEHEVYDDKFLREGRWRGKYNM